MSVRRTETIYVVDSYVSFTSVIVFHFLISLGMCSNKGWTHVYVWTVFSRFWITVLTYYLSGLGGGASLSYSGGRRTGGSVPNLGSERANPFQFIPQVQVQWYCILSTNWSISWLVFEIGLKAVSISLTFWKCYWGGGEYFQKPINLFFQLNEVIN